MCQNGAFFAPVKYTLIYHVLQVSWAARHTTVCLDMYSLFNLKFCIVELQTKEDRVLLEQYLDIIFFFALNWNMTYKEDEFLIKHCNFLNNICCKSNAMGMQK